MRLSSISVLFRRAFRGLVIASGTALLLSSPSLATPYLYGTAKGDASPAFNEANLRPYANGAGPSAIFRLGRQGGQDILGIVDPVGWRIQFFALDDWSPEGGLPLRQRIHWRGACLLNPAQRVWRVHVWPDHIVLQLQPEPSLEQIASGQALAFPKIVIRADPAALAMVQAQQPALDLDAKPASCDIMSGPAGTGSFTAADAPVTITGGDTQRFHVIHKNASGGDTPFLRSEIVIGTSATNRLTQTGGVIPSVQELEAAKSVHGNVDLRHFLLTARSDALPGFAHSIVMLERRSDGGTLDGTMQIDMGLARVKTGQRFLAVSSKGEVLLIGASNKNAFRITACHFTDEVSAQRPCRVTHEAPGADGAVEATAQRQTPRANLPPIASTNQIWAKASWYVNQLYRIDPRGMLPECRAIAPCKVAGHDGAWSVISVLRLADGPVTRRGVPYAQRHVAGQVPSREMPSGPLPTVLSEDGTTILLPAYRQDGATYYVVSDIENSALRSDLPDVKLFGIDCSAFLNAIWGSPLRETDEMIVLANKKELARISAMAKFNPGDAFIVNLSDEGDQLLNHVVVYRERVSAGPGDNSRALLVLEASSACGGVCTTLYDESFFDGWALLNRGVPDPNSALIDIPLDYGEWLKKLHGDEPRSNNPDTH